MRTGFLLVSLLLAGNLAAQDSPFKEKWYEYCYTVEGAVATVENYMRKLRGKKQDKALQEINQSDCKNLIVTSEEEDNRIDIAIKEPVQFGGADLITHVKFAGEEYPLRITYVYADIYFDGEITRKNILFQQETPVSKEEYNAARTEARSGTSE